MDLILDAKIRKLENMEELISRKGAELGWNSPDMDLAVMANWDSTRCVATETALREMIEQRKKLLAEINELLDIEDEPEATPESVKL